MSRLRRVFTSNANVVVLGAGGDSGLKVHAIEQDEKQSQAMMANLRTYKPASQLWKLVPNTKFRGQVDPSAEEGKDEVLPVDIKCTKCGKDTQVPPAEKCHSCGGHVCPTCLPRLGAAECPVCDDFFRLVDVVVPVEFAV